MSMIFGSSENGYYCKNGCRKKSNTSSTTNTSNKNISSLKSTSSKPSYTYNSYSKSIKPIAEPAVSQSIRSKPKTNYYNGFNNFSTGLNTFDGCDSFSGGCDSGGFDGCD
jgi:hypothetical protein